MMGIDQFMRYRRLIDQNAKPAKGIDPLEGGQRLLWHALARDAVIAIAARDHGAIEPLGNAILAIGHMRRGAVKVMQLHVVSVIDGGGAGCRPGFHQVARHFGLSIDHDLPPDQRREVDAVTVAIKAELNPFMQQTLLMHAAADSGAVHQRHAALLEHAGANARQHIVGAPALDDDSLDSRQFQQAAEHQPGRTRADNGDLCAHAASSHGTSMLDFLLALSNGQARQSLG